MNLFVANPHWGWWIILYFYFGGIAAGAYFAATLCDLIGRGAYRSLSRRGYWIAFPLVSVCGVLLIVDLDRPERFWHMMLRSEVVHGALEQGWPWNGASWRTLVHAPLLKHWSPMSIGSWALLLFGMCSGLSLLGSLWPDGRLARWFGGGMWGRALQGVGCAVGFFVASYTGTLLTATNQPLWSDTPWIAPLFLTSAGSTGLAALLLLSPRRADSPIESLHRLERAEQLALLLELGVFIIFLASLGTMLHAVLATRHGMLLVAGTLLVGILLPLILRTRRLRLGRHSAILAATLALVGGFLMRYAILRTPPELLAHASDRGVGAESISPHTPGRPGFSPEDGRPPLSPGADAGNRPADLQPGRKVLDDD